MDGLRPYPIYLLVNVAFELAFMLYATIASVYRIQTVGLDPPQLVLVGTALELAILVFEVPTGVLADTYGRRRSVIAGFFLIGAGFSFEGALPTFGTVLAAQVVWGVGYTFVSGVEPGVRATVISMSSQADALGQVAGGPAVGAVGTVAGIRAALAVAAFALSPALLLYAKAIQGGPTLLGGQNGPRKCNRRY